VESWRLYDDPTSDKPQGGGAVSAAAGGAAVRPVVADGVVLRLVDRCAETVVAVALVGELALVVANVVARAYLHHSFLWADELARLALSILAFVGGAIAYRRRDHAFVRVVLSLFPGAVERACLALADVLVLLIAALTAYASLEFIASSWNPPTSASPTTPARPTSRSSATSSSNRGRRSAATSPSGSR
jgi:TRAP-type C4-dicarboxylate transport system permease small subunit